MNSDRTLIILKLAYQERSLVEFSKLVKYLLKSGSEKEKQQKQDFADLLKILNRKY